MENKDIKAVAKQMIEERISNRISRSIAQIFTGYPKNSINDI